VYYKRDRLKTAYFITAFIGLLYKCTYFLMRGYGTYRSFASTAPQLKICDFSGETFKGFESAIIFYKCNDDTTALQRRVLQTAL
jgi:hypothetical protein